MKTEHCYNLQIKLTPCIDCIFALAVVYFERILKRALKHVTMRLMLSRQRLGRGIRSGSHSGPLDSPRMGAAAPENYWHPKSTALFCTMNFTHIMLETTGKRTRQGESDEKHNTGDKCITHSMTWVMHLSTVSCFLSLWPCLIRFQLFLFQCYKCVCVPSPTWPRGQNFGLGLVASGLVLVLMQCWPRSCQGCPCGLVVSHRNRVIYVTFFSDRKMLLAL